MAEYIEREKALSFPFANGKYDHANANEHFINGCETYKEWLIDIPAADVAPVRHGQWIPVDEMEDAFDCSECDAMVSKRLNYCPKCGAKMDKEVQDGRPGVHSGNRMEGNRAGELLPVL